MRTDSAPPTAPFATPAVILDRPVPLADQVLDALRQRIVEGRLVAGTLLPEARLAVEFGVSRVPVREALAQLREDGLALPAPHGRTRVAPTRPDDLREIVSLRLALERLAVSETIRLAAETSLDRLRELAGADRATSSLAELARLDVRFHEALVEAAGHRRLLESWRAIKWPYLRWLAETYRTHRLATLKAVRASMAQHVELVRLLERRDEAAAIQSLSRHIEEWSDWFPTSVPRPVSTRPRKKP